MNRQAFSVSGLGLVLLLAGCSPVDGPGSESRADDAVETSTAIVFSDFDGPSVPRNRGGDSYPDVYAGEGSKGTVAITDEDAVEGRCLRVDVSQKGLYLQWNPYDGVGRGFAREYALDGKKWRFNTYNRLSFWIKRPVSASPLAPDGRTNVEVGTYVKRVDGADARSDESGGSHYYHSLNLPNNGRWTRVILSMRPDHRRGDPGNADAGYLPHPTNEPEYNYFDALTRFYIDDTATPTIGVYLVDDVRLYRQSDPENDVQVYSLASVHDPERGELIVTWRRPKDENDVAHEVRYAFRDIHEIGWSAATPAPEGTVKPPGWQGYNGMVYTSTALPLSGRSTVYVAIKPSDSKLFSQIEVPLGRTEASTDGGRASRAAVAESSPRPSPTAGASRREPASASAPPPAARKRNASPARRVDPNARRARRPTTSP